MIEVYATLGLAAVAAITWAVRLEGRVNSHDKILEAHAITHQEIKQAIADVARDVKTLLFKHYSR